MTKFLAGVLSVIAVGVMLIAYSLLNAHAAAVGSNGDMDTSARPMLASERIMLNNDRYLNNDPYAGNPYLLRYPPSYAYPAPASATAPARPVRTTDAVRAPQQAMRRVIPRVPKRDWRKTAIVIGGSSAAGAGIGAIFGGGKGALIGAAIGGGASTLYEATKK